MKKVLLIVFLILTGSQAFSQNTTVTPCNGNTSKSADAFTKSIYFSAVGINLNKYDWQNTDVNCHINSVLSNRKQASWMSTGAWVLVGLGASAILGSLGSVNNEYAGGIGKTFTTVGAVMLGGSIPLFIGASKKKKKANKHLMEVSDYYREQGL